MYPGRKPPDPGGATDSAAWRRMMRLSLPRWWCRLTRHWPRTCGDDPVQQTDASASARIVELDRQAHVSDRKRLLQFSPQDPQAHRRHEKQQDKDQNPGQSEQCPFADSHVSPARSSHPKGPIYFQSASFGPQSICEAEVIDNHALTESSLQSLRTELPETDPPNRRYKL